MTQDLLDPKIDIVFKMLFSDEPTLSGLRRMKVDIFDILVG